jgi:uncharacterized protein (TIGR03435 family)
MTRWFGCVALLTCTGILIAPVSAQTAASDEPRFEVASIRRCNGGDPSAKGGGRGGAGPTDGASSPDRLRLNCQPVRNFVRAAYVLNGKFNPLARLPIEGGPGWIDTDRYQIVAKAEGAPGQETMRGPMLRALLEERLKLKVHREVREVPVYALTVAKKGPKLEPFKEGSCMLLDFSKPPALPGAGEKFLPFCGLALRKRNGVNVSWEVRGGSLDDLSAALSFDLDRTVINRTGITGKFDFHLEFAPDETTTGLNALRVEGGEPAFPQPGTASDPSGGTSIFTAIQGQLGLKLEATKGPREFLIIDRVERPSAN